MRAVMWNKSGIGWINGQRVIRMGDLPQKDELQ
jgi:hypothetical protein